MTAPAAPPEPHPLGPLLTTLQEQNKTGTLKVSGDGGRVKYIYFKRGSVELLKTNHSRTLLGKALYKRHKLTEEQLDAALERQKAATQHIRLGEILIGMGIVRESDVHQALGYQVAEEVFELFGWPKVETEFFRGEPPLDIFESEDLQARVSLSPVQLTREAVRRQQELAEIQRTLASWRDVFAATGRAYRPGSHDGPADQEVLACLNGKRTVEELLDAVRAPDLVALRVLAKMVEAGDVVPLSAGDLLALGQELEERSERDRALVRYLRAEELGHPDFDLPRRIGQIVEIQGDLKEACRRYSAYADRCDQAGYPDVAAQTLVRVLEIDPTQTAIRERLAELHVKRARRAREANDSQADELLALASKAYEELLAKADGAEEQRRLLAELVELQPDRHDLRERLAELSLELGDPAQAVLELQELAASALEAQEWERAVAVLEKILSIDPGDIMTVQSLASTYARLDRTEDAVRQYLSFADRLVESGLATASGDTLVEIYERVVELDPGHTEARKILADAYAKRKNADQAIDHQSQVVTALRSGETQDELLDALRKMHDLKPNDVETAVELAKLESRLGDPAASGKILRGVAESAQLKGEEETAARAWKELLDLEPGNLEGHLALARLHGQLNLDLEVAARRCAAVFELALLASDDELAYEAVKQALDINPDDPGHRRRLAEVQARRGRKQEAARTLVRAARRARDDEDLGISKTWARRALELDEDCQEARELLENLRRNKAPAPEAPPEQRGPTVQATITGGGRPGIEGIQHKSKKVGNIADRLRSMKLGTSPRTAPSEERARVSKKATSALNKLRALRSGAPSTPAPTERKVAKGPEAPGAAADAKVSKKATSALNKLKALRSGAPSTPAPTERKVAKGPEAPGAAADAKVSKKATSALNKLKALRSGAPSTPAPTERKVAKGPEAPGAAADAKVSKKATSALNKLKALRSGAPSTPAPTERKVAKGPEAPGAAADAKVSKKATSALNKLKALRSGAPSTPAPTERKVAKGPEAPGAAADAKVSKKATSALNKLKALRSGAPSTPAPAERKVAKGPEAPGEAASAQVSKKASSAMDRLRALRGGGG